MNREAIFIVTYTIIIPIVTCKACSLYASSMPMQVECTTGDRAGIGESGIYVLEPDDIWVIVFVECRVIVLTLHSGPLNRTTSSCISGVVETSVESYRIE